MSLSFLFFLERLGLTDDYFGKVAESLVLTRSEFGSFDRLTRAGFFSSDRIGALVEQGYVVEAPKAAVDDEIKQKVDSSIQSSAAVYREISASMVVTEDPVLRDRAEAAGMRVVSTPDIVFQMAQKGVIDKDRALEAIGGLELIGWHDKAVLDRIKETIRCL